jgi:hypothetical protein
MPFGCPSCDRQFFADLAIAQAVSHEHGNLQLTSSTMLEVLDHKPLSGAIKALNDQ